MDLVLLILRLYLFGICFLITGITGIVLKQDAYSVQFIIIAAVAFIAATIIRIKLPKIAAVSNSSNSTKKRKDKRVKNNIYFLKSKLQQIERLKNEAGLSEAEYKIKKKQLISRYKCSSGKIISISNAHFRLF